MAHEAESYGMRAGRGRVARPAVAIAATAAGLTLLAPAMTSAASASTASARTASSARAVSAHAAPAASKPVNLIRDAGADRAKGNSGGGQVKVPDWKPLKGSMFTAVPYGAPEFPGKHSPGPKNRGKNFFAGGPSGNTSGATQTDSLAAYQRLIGEGKAKFSLSAWLGGYSSQGDHATLTVIWRSASGAELGHVTLGPVTVRQRKDVTGLLHRSKSGIVPKGATQAEVKLHMVRDDGEYVDGYADSLRLTIAKS